MTEYVEKLKGEKVLFTGKVSDGGLYDKREKVQELARLHGATIMPDRNREVTLLVLGDYQLDAPKYKESDLAKKAMFALNMVQEGRPVKIISSAGFFDLIEGKPARVLNNEILARLSL